MVMTLCACVEIQRWQVKFQDAKVLNQNSIHTDVIQRLKKYSNIFHFIIEDQSVDGNVNFGSVDMGIIHEGFDILKGVGGGLSRAEGRSTYIHSVGAVVDSCLAALQITRR